MTDSTTDESGAAPSGEGGGAPSPGAADSAEGKMDATDVGPRSKASDGVAGDGPESEIDALRRDLDELQDRYLRLAAEFDNFRRRSIAQRSESEVRAQAGLIASILDALDDMGRVTSLDPEAATVESVLEGVALVERKLQHRLQEAGLEEVNPVGEAFDPNVMEAMTRVAADTPEEDDTVDQVFQRGFRFRGQLVRPARVSVRKHE